MHTQSAQTLSTLAISALLLQSCGSNLMLSEQRAEMRKKNEPHSTEAAPELRAQKEKTTDTLQAQAKGLPPAYTAPDAWRALQQRLNPSFPLERRGRLLGGAGSDDEGAREEIQSAAPAGEEVKMDIEEEAKKQAAHPRLSHLPQQHPQHYVAREHAQRQLVEHIATAGFCIITGHGGAGKTTLAAAYAHHQKALKSVYWIPAETSDQLILGVRQMADELAIDYQSLDQECAAQPLIYFARLLQLVYQKLQKQPLLIVFDNAEATTKTWIEAALADSPPSVQVLITTRDAPTFDSQSSLPLVAFQEPEARQYVRECLAGMGRPAQEALVEALLEEVGLIPQPLSLAMGYLQTRPAITIEEYLGRLRAIKQGHGQEHDRLLLPEVALGIEGLEEAGQVLLHYSAYLDADNIPLALLEAVLDEEDERKIDQAVALLRGLSLVSVRYDASGKTHLQMHRQVQQACRTYQAWQGAAAMDRGRLLGRLTEALAELMPEVGTRHDQSWAQAALYALHGEKIAAESLEQGVAPQTATGVLLTRLGHYKSKVQHQLAEGLAYQEQALALRRVLHDEDPHVDLAYSWSLVGSGYAQIGDYRQALAHKLEALRVHEQLPQEAVNAHQKAQVLNGLGELYWRVGQARLGLDYAQQGLALYENEQLFHGLARRLKARAMNTVGLNLEQLGRYEEALQYKDAALGLRIRCEDIPQAREGQAYPDHLDIAHFLTSVGEALIKVGRLAEGADYFQKALEMRQRHYGDQAHFHLAYSLMRVGACLSQQGQAEAGLEHVERSLQMLEETDPGRDHAYKALSLCVKGESLRELGRLAESLAALQEAMEMQERLFVDTAYPQETVHPALARTLTELGLSYERQWNRIEARRYYERAAGMLEVLFPEGEHPELARVRQHLARVQEA